MQGKARYGTLGLKSLHTHKLHMTQYSKRYSTCILEDLDAFMWHALVGLSLLFVFAEMSP